MAKGRSFTDIKKEYGFDAKKIGELAKKVTETYANSKEEYSQSQVAKQFDISVVCLRKLMDYAIITNAVSITKATQVMEKSIRNQQRMHAEAGGTSIAHHNELMRQREDYIVMSFNNEQIKAIVKSAVTDPYFRKTTERFNIEKRVVQKVLERAIQDNIATDDETDVLINRSISMNKSEWVKKYFENLRKIRKQNQEKEKENSD